MLTDNGIQFTTLGAGGSAVPLIKEVIANDEVFRAYAFEYAAPETRSNTDHQHKHPCTNGQVARMGLTPFELICKAWGEQPGGSPSIRSSKCQE